jgi:CBS domain-containing protein
MDAGRLLTADRILVPLLADSVEGGLSELRKLAGEGAEEARDSGFHPSGSALLQLRRKAPRDLMLLGVSPEPLRGPVTLSDPAGDGAPRREIRTLVVLETRGPGPADGDPPVELVEALADPEVEAALLRATDARDVRGIRRLLAARVSDPARVGEAIVPMEYRVYPDTPVSEVMDLMARKGLSAVPVVGEAMQVVGILTAGDAIRLHLERGIRVQRLPTREAMTRAVLCVTEEQTLEEAARIMVNRNLRQLPVVREGEMVGFLTRESVLRGLHGGLPSS